MSPDETLSPSPGNPVAGVRIDRCLCIDTARSRTWRASLFVNDEETSHVMEMVRPRRSPDDKRLDIVAAWLAVDEATGKDIGAALVSANPWQDGPSPVLNLYVDADHQGRGIGSRLVAHVLSEFPQVSANFTLDSVRIYERAKLQPANLPVWFCAEEEYPERRTKFVQQLLQDRADYDRVASQVRPVLFKP